MIMQDDAGGEAAYSSIIMIMQLWTSHKRFKGSYRSSFEAKLLAW